VAISGLPGEKLKQNHVQNVNLTDGIKKGDKK